MKLSPVTSYRHHCRWCKREELVPAGNKSSSDVKYPRCCGKAMAYIGTVEPPKA